MADMPAQAVHVGQSLGFFGLGSSLHYVLTRIKSEPSIYPKIQLFYSPSEPLLHHIIVALPANGVRLTFDAPEQRLRFVEVLEFGKTRLQYKGQDIVKLPPPEDAAFGSPVDGPIFKHVYKLFGPTTPGEFVGRDGETGKYCLSYPGISFWFPVRAPDGFTKLDWASTVSILSSSACKSAGSMVIFEGESWPVARKNIFTADMTHLWRTPVISGRKEGIPAEISMAKVHDRGKIELVRKDAPNFWIILSETTQQDLLTELGPPDSTYKKSNRNTSAHHHRRTSSTSSRESSGRMLGDRSPNGHSETEDSSAWSDEEEDPDETVLVNDKDDKDDAGVWWNYYSHGLDILITQPSRISTRSPTATRHSDSEDASEDEDAEPTARSHLTATKVILHSNVPGSYQFNRHRRLRWTLDSWPSSMGTYTDALTSEMKFRDIQGRLRDVFQQSYDTQEEEKEQQQPMAINRDWGEGSSLGGSVELLGGWEEGGKRKIDASSTEGDADKIGEVMMFGFPGLAFEVLKNGVVGLLQVW